MHEPYWENPSESFKAIVEMVKDRDHKFFGGHLHYYDYDIINGFKYITMGPAGASFHHDGPGNADYIMWVTMTVMAMKNKWPMQHTFYSKVC